MAVIYFKSQSSLGKLSMKKWMSPNELKNGTEDLIEFEEVGKRLTNEVLTGLLLSLNHIADYFKALKEL